MVALLFKLLSILVFLCETDPLVASLELVEQVKSAYDPIKCKKIR